MEPVEPERCHGCPSSMRATVLWCGLCLSTLVMLCGCRPGLRPLASGWAGSAMAPASPQKAAEAPPCSGRPIEMLLTPPVWKDCATLQDCTAALDLYVRNCTPAQVVPEQVQLVEDSPVMYRQSQVWEVDRVALGPGASHRYPIRPVRDTLHDLLVWVSFRDPSGQLRQSSLRSAQLTSPARPAAEEACRRCNGVFGRLGLRVWVLSCRCETPKMRDADTPCDDGEQCEGWCLYERLEKVPARAEHPQPRAVTERPMGRPSVPSVAEHRPVGRCSSFGPDGCSETFRFIRKGASRLPSSPIAQGVETQSCAVE